MRRLHNYPTRQYMAESRRIVGNRELFSIVRDTLLEGESVKVAVQGQSMIPFFRSGSTITLRPLREGDIRKYNVVLADAEHSFVVHRIIGVAGDTITLLGDGNPRTPEVVSRDKIYGIVDCSRIHLLLARLWVWLRPLRRYPLAVMRRMQN